MIDKLHIKNFLAFPELVVPELKQINLVAGKNTTGKTALLQAVSILYDDLRHESTEEILISRNIRAKDIFNTKSVPDNYEFVINHLQGKLAPYDTISYFYVDDQSRVLEVVPSPLEDAVSVKLTSISQREELQGLWKKTALTELEIEVIDIVNTAMGLDIARLSILDSDIKVLLHGHKHPVQIDSLGDGILRVLHIALSLVNSKNSLLLIDEIETHLHYSVIRKLWKIIFEHSVKWNIQVVATTHSMDAIRQFWYEAATKENYQDISQVLRLQVGREGKYEVVEFPFDRLDSVMEMEMEIR